MPRHYRGYLELPRQAPLGQRRRPQCLLKRDMLLHAVEEQQRLGADYAGRAPDGGHIRGVDHVEILTRGAVAKGEDYVAEECEASSA